MGTLCDSHQTFIGFQHNSKNSAGSEKVNKCITKLFVTLYTIVANNINALITLLLMLSGRGPAVRIVDIIEGTIS